MRIYELYFINKYELSQLNMHNQEEFKEVKQEIIVYNQQQFEFSEDVDYLLSREEVNLGRYFGYEEKGKWNEFEGQMKMKYIQEWKIKQLRLRQNSRKYILRELSHIDFPNLKLLNVGGNQIQSVEGFHRISMPNLSRLYIWQNKITKVSDFSKANMANLKFVSIGGNKIQQSNAYSKMYTPEMDTLRQQYQRNEKHLINMNWICKFQADLLYEISFRSDNRIVQAPLLNSIKRKFPNIVLSVKSE